jgi:hypothetical protein
MEKKGYDEYNEKRKKKKNNKTKHIGSPSSSSTERLSRMYKILLCAMLKHHHTQKNCTYTHTQAGEREKEEIARTTVQMKKIVPDEERKKNVCRMCLFFFCFIHSRKTTTTK